MNFVKGEMIGADKREQALKALPASITETLMKPPLLAHEVIAACDSLSTMLDESYVALLVETGIEQHKANEYINEAKAQLSADYLQHKLATELGGTYGSLREVSVKGKPATEEVLPLGVLFHIVAGNVDALPAYSVIEGLLVGNINLVKLPSSDNDLSLYILGVLVSIEPRLADYIYVFDYSSQDVEELEFLASLADAVVIWGGDTAISAARAMAKPNTKIIEWGHKISFAYGVPGLELDESLDALALSMVETRQLLCSSCQGLYIDTEDKQVLQHYARRLLKALEVHAALNPLDIGLQAKVGLQVHSAELESIYKPQTVLQEKSSSVIVGEDSLLVTSIQFGNCWVKPLPRKEIIGVLKPYKNYLQTCALLCSDDDYEVLKQSLYRAGIVRVCAADAMTATYSAMPHDGEYALQRYTKVVSG